MSKFFMISSDDAETRLKSFSGTFSGAKGTVRIQLEIDNPGVNLGYLLRQLEEFSEAQKAAIKSTRKTSKERGAKRVTHQKPLALPAPEGAL